MHSFLYYYPYMRRLAPQLFIMTLMSRYFFFRRTASYFVGTTRALTGYLLEQVDASHVFVLYGSLHKSKPELHEVKQPEYVSIDFTRCVGGRFGGPPLH